VTTHQKKAILSDGLSGIEGIYVLCYPLHFVDEFKIAPGGSAGGKSDLLR
jgi:hypothetical protein